MHAPRCLALPITLLLVACPDSPGPEAPTVIITSPSDGALVTAGHGVELVAVVGDADDVPELLKVTWSADGQPACADLVPRPDGSSTCTWVAELEGGAIEVVVADPGGLSASATISLTVQALNREPSCSLEAPSDGSGFGLTEVITVSGSVDDDDDTVEVVISSSIDKELGSTQAAGSGSFQLEVGPLSAGDHSLTMVVTDPHGASCSGQVGVVIGAEDTAPPPDTDAPAPDTDEPSTDV